jgi:hypothetical protein
MSLLRFKLWAIEKALRCHFGGQGENFRAVGLSAQSQVTPRRAQIALWSLLNFGIAWPAVEHYRAADRQWLEGMTAELLFLLPRPFDGHGMRIFRLAIAAAIGTLMSGVFGPLMAGAIALLVVYPLIHVTECWIAISGSRQRFTEATDHEQ